MARTVQEKRAAFRALHAEGCFVLQRAERGALLLDGAGHGISGR